MPLSYTQYTGNGTTTDFMLSFPYLNKWHVVLKINGITTAYTWINDVTIRTSTAPANGSTVWIYRNTPRNDLLTVFQDSVGFREADLNRLAKQLLYISQEAYENVDLPTLAEWREEFRQGLAEMRVLRTDTQNFVQNFQSLLDGAEAILDTYATEKTLALEAAAQTAITNINLATTGLASGVQEIVAARQEIAAARTLIEQLMATVQAHRQAAETAAAAANTAKNDAQGVVATVTTLKNDVLQIKADTEGIKTQTSELYVQSAAVNEQVDAVLVEAEDVKEDCEAVLAQIQTIQTDTNTMKTAAETAKTQAEGFAANASTSANTAQAAASAAQAAAQTAFGAEAPAWVEGTAYSYPDVVAGPDGHTYRCIGTGITTNPVTDINGWTRITIGPTSAFEHDVDGNLMPSFPPVASSEWDIDGDGNIMPKE